MTAMLERKRVPSRDLMETCLYITVAHRRITPTHSPLQQKTTVPKRFVKVLEYPMAF